MNVYTLNNDLVKIYQPLATTKSALKNRGDLSEIDRFKFNNALEEILKILKMDYNYNSIYEHWPIAYRIVEFNKISSKLRKIQTLILHILVQPYFCNKIKFLILPSLEGRMGELKRFIVTLGRLPFSFGESRTLYFEQVKKLLALEDLADTHDFEKEYFHLLGDDFDSQKLENIDLDPYCSNLEIYSLISWSKVLETFIDEGDAEEKRVGENLLKMINRNLPIALKTSYAYHLPQIKARRVNQIPYLSDLVAMRKCDSLSISTPSLIPDEFYSKYSLDNRGAVPQFILINEIVWDMLNVIHQMKEGDQDIFLLGTRSHLVAVEISCLETPNCSHQGNFKYTIFNTGSGVGHFHWMKWEKNQYVSRPVTYHDLPRSIFSYWFFAELVLLSLQKNRISDFYHWHDYIFVGNGGGRKDVESGDWYSLQKNKICSYRVVEAWLKSKLTEAQKLHLNLIKAKLSTRKLEKVVTALEKDQWKLVTNKRRKIKRQEKPVKLISSKILLKLGEKYLQKVSETLYLPDA